MTIRATMIATAVAGLFAASASGAEPSAKAGAAKGGEQVMCSGINSCKGTDSCHGTGHGCAGQNACKGKGATKTTKEECVKKGGKVLPPAK